MKASSLFLVTVCVASATAPLGCTGIVDIAKMPDGDGGPDSNVAKVGDSGARFQGQDADVGTQEDAKGPSGGDSGGPTCTDSAGCGVGFVCGFAVDGGCGAVGRCFAEAPGCTAPATPGCACDGTEINLTSCNVGLPGANVVKPLAHAGVCSADAGSHDASASGPPCPEGWHLMDGYCSGLCNSGYSCSCADGTKAFAVCPLDGPMACAALCGGHGGSVVPDGG